MAFDLSSATTAIGPYDPPKKKFDLSSAKSIEPPKPKREPIKVPESLADISTPSTHSERVLHGVMDPVMGLGQGASHLFYLDQLNSAIDKLGIPGLPKAVSYDTAMQNRSREYEASRAAAGSKGFDWDRLGGNALAAAVPMGPAMQLPGLAAKVGAGGLAGLAGGAIQPVESGNYAEQMPKNAAMSGAFGAAGPVAGQAASRLIAPRIAPKVASLAEKGVNMTPGQLFGPTAKRLEDAASSIPLIGDVIKSGQSKSIQSFNKAAAQEALSPIGVKLPNDVPAGHKLIAYVQGKLDDAYTKLLPKLKGNLHSAPPTASQLPTTAGSVLPKNFEGQVRDIQSMVRQSGIPNEKTSELNRFLDNDVIGRFTKQGKADGLTLKAMQESLGLEIARLGKGGPDDRQLAQALKQVRQNLHEMIERENPGQKDVLDKINSGWANFKRLQRAQPMKDEAFSPNALLQSIKALDRSKDKSLSKAGRAPMQSGLAAPAGEVLPQRLPDSGTPYRLLLDALLAGGAGMGAHAMGAGAMGAGAGLGAAAGLYTNPGMAALRQYATPALIRQMLGAGTGAGITAAAPQIPQRMQQP